MTHKGMILASFGTGFCATMLAVASWAEPVTVLDSTLTGNASFASDYVFRGYSQNDEKMTPMLSGSWNHISGVHVDLFAAPVDFNANDDARWEVDATVGYGFEVMDGLTGDVSWVNYFYPGADSDANYNYMEGVGSLSYDFGAFVGQGLLAYSPEFFGNTGQALFAELSAEAPIDVVQGLSANAGLGRQLVEESQDYTTWRVGLDYALAGPLDGVTVGVMYTDTDVNQNRCNGLCGSRVVGTVSYSF